jgi:hypothetical protein
MREIKLMMHFPMHRWVGYWERNILLLIQCRILSVVKTILKINRQYEQYFSYVVAVSFIGGRNGSTRRKPPTCRKSLTNFITEC